MLIEAKNHGDVRTTDRTRTSYTFQVTNTWFAKSLMVTLTLKWPRTFIMLHFATHTHDIPAFSSPAFSSPAFSASPLRPLLHLLRYPVADHVDAFLQCGWQSVNNRGAGVGYLRATICLSRRVLQSLRECRCTGVTEIAGLENDGPSK